jgi:hypothetical protein
MAEKDWPDGHPCSAIYDPNSEAAKAFIPPAPLNLYWPAGHPAASTTPAETINGGYKATLVKTEDALQHGGLALRSKDVLVVSCPLHGDRHVIPLTEFRFDPNGPSVEGTIVLSCGAHAEIHKGVWHLD